MTGLPSKQYWLDLAEVFDAWRFFPRALLAAYWTWVIQVTSSLLFWYQALPASERSLESSGLAAAVITAVTGLASWASKIYMQSGRRWAPTNDGGEA
jgi:hypothetical protein